MGNERSGLVLHVCCAPDEAWALQTLLPLHDLHCFFCNPNIQPAQEYEARLNDARSVAHRYGVPFSEDPYEPACWEQAVAGMEHTGEGGERCRRCFILRFRRTARFCRESGINAFASVMSVSPHKNFSLLCQAGVTAAAEFGVRFAPIDLKKNDGFAQSVRLSRELGLYRQDYCGCRLSKAEAAQRRRRLTMRCVNL